METYDGPDALGYVVASNLHRRHLNESQRSMVAEKLANMKVGGDRRSDHSANLQNGRVSQTEAARLLGVSTRSVASAAAVRNNGTPELVAAVEQGDIAVSVAAELAELPEDQQAQAVAQPDRATHLAKKHKRQLREARTDLTSSNGSTKLAALDKAGISKVQASQWERLAAIPREDFEADLADPMWRHASAWRRRATLRAMIQPSAV